MTERAKSWISSNALNFLRVSIGVIYLWFGILKFFSGLSPAEDLAGKTLSVMTFYMVDQTILLYILAIWECGIGIFFLLNRQMRIVLLSMLVHMLGTLMPFFLFPHDTFTEIPYALTLVGQYIIKNFALITGAVILFVSLEDKEGDGKEKRSPAVSTS